MSVPDPVPRTRRKDARPAELLAAALDVFVDKGFAAARVEEIARKAGVSKATVFLYFPSKEALFEAVVAEAVLPRIAEGEALLTDLADPAAALETVLRFFWQTVGEGRLAGIPKLMLAEAGNFPQVAQFYFDHVVLRCRAALCRALQAGMTAGVFRPGNVEVLAQLAVAPLLFNSMWRQAMQACDPQQASAEVFFNTHLAHYMRALRMAPDAELNIKELE